MDSIKGAIVLCQRFANGSSPPAPDAGSVPDDALPIVHWIAAGLAAEASVPADAADG
jgi:hypothetical protein